MTSFSSRDDGEGCHQGVLVQGYDSMEVNGHNRVKDIIVKELGSFWNKRGRREEASSAGRREF